MGALIYGPYDSIRGVGGFTGLNAADPHYTQDMDYSGDTILLMVVITLGFPINPPW